MRAGWVLRGGDVLAAADIADGLVERSMGLARRDRYDAALVIVPGAPVHSLATRFGLDVAFLDTDLQAVEALHLRPRRVARPRRRCRAVLETSAGTFERWRLSVGDVLEVREVHSGPMGTPPIFPTP